MVKDMVTVFDDSSGIFLFDYSKQKYDFLETKRFMIMIIHKSAIGNG